MKCQDLFSLKKKVSATILHGTLRINVYVESEGKVTMMHICSISVHLQ